MNIAIGCDPNAAPLKKEITEELEKEGHTLKDFGSDDPIYANVVIALAEAVVRGDFDCGIVLCGTGIGVSIAANKVPGAYCALVSNAYQAERAALSNNANIIAMGQQVTGNMLARMMARIYVENAGNFNPAGRSAPKVQRICDYAKSHEK